MTPIGPSAEQVEYRLGGGHGCPDHQFSYHADGRERPLEWIGNGLADVGVVAGSELTAEAFDTARALMNGVDPRTGEVLVTPKVAVPEDAKVPLARLVEAATRVAAADGVNVEDLALLASKKLAAQWRTALRSVASKGENARMRADEAGALADVLGISAESVWGEDVYATAVGNLFTTERTTAQDGRVSERRVPRRVEVGNRGYDITFTLPKSHSVLMGFASPEVASELETVYMAKVREAFAWVEKIAAYGMRGKHGSGHTAEVVEGRGLLGWTMVHRSARPVGDDPVGDPHWHVHVSVANLTLGVDGKWSTIGAGGRDLMRHMPAADQLAKALVRHELWTRWGIEFERRDGSGAWEVAAIPEETVRRFSRRHSSISAALMALGLDGEQASRAQKRIAEQSDRGAKSEAMLAADATLQERWRARETAAGGDPDAQVRDAFGAGWQPREVPLKKLVEVLLDPDTGLTSHSRRFTRAEALWRVADALPGGIESAAALEELTDKVLAEVGFVPLPIAVDGASHLRNSQAWTTSDVVDAERTILRAAQAAAPDQSTTVLVSDEVAEMAMETVEASQGFALSSEQRHAVRRLLREGRMVDAVNGAPGTGKTTMLRALRVGFEAAGFVVAGAATAAVAAQNLQTESGIESRTVASMLHPAKRTVIPAGVDVLVLDEANLTEDRDRAALYRAAAQHGVRIIEVGDSKQLRGVGVGSLFGRVHRTVEGPSLNDNRRQSAEDERRAITAWRESRYTDALATWAGKGALVATRTSDEATAAMLAQWRERRQGAPDPHAEMRGLLMLASTNERVTRLNQGAQAIRAAQGELGDPIDLRLNAGGSLTLHVGDHVLLRVNAHEAPEIIKGSGVLNGYRGVVESISPQGHVVVSWMQEESGGTLERHTATLSHAYIASGGVELGYAMTVHKAEGLTVGQRWEHPAGGQSGASVLVDPTGADNPSLHVATSRHRAEVAVFAALDAIEEPEIAQRLGPAEDRAVPDRVAAALARRAEATETSANDRPVLDDLERRPMPTRGRSEDEELARQWTRSQRIEQESRARERERIKEVLVSSWGDTALAEQIMHASAFRAVVSAIQRTERAGEDPAAVLRSVRVEHVRSASDPAAYTAAVLRAEQERPTPAAAARITVPTPSPSDPAPALREAWPEPAVERVMDSPAKDALARALDVYEHDGLDVVSILERIGPAKALDPVVRDPAAWTTAAVHREAAVQARRRDIVAERTGAAAVVRRAWAEAPETAEAVIEGHAFGVLAERMAFAERIGVDAEQALKNINPQALTGKYIPPAATAVVALGQVTRREAPPVPRWEERPLGSMPDAQLWRERLTASEKLTELERTRSAVAEQVEALAAVVAEQRGPAAQAVDERLARALEQQRALETYTAAHGRWENAREQLQHAATERAALEAERAQTRGRRTGDLDARITQAQAKERDAAEQTREFAAQVRAVPGVPESGEERRRLRVRTAAELRDAPDAAASAQHRDEAAEHEAQRQLGRVDERIEQGRATVNGLRSEEQNRALLAPERRRAEELARRTPVQVAGGVAEPVPTMAVPAPGVRVHPETPAPGVQVSPAPAVRPPTAIRPGTPRIGR